MALTKSEKMDMAGARTPADIERKYNFGKSFAELQGVATDARNAAEEAQEAAEKATDHEAVLNALTKNGEIQCMREIDGQIYINAAYIQSLEMLFANNIVMSGTFSNTAEVFIEPDETEVETIRQHILGNVPIPNALIPSYDFNNDGVVDSIDHLLARKAWTGVSSLASWSGAKKSTVTLTIDMKDPNKTIKITGKNMWGRNIESYIGVNFTTIRNSSTEQRLYDLEQRIIALESV